MHEMMELYRDFICSISRLDYIIKKLFDHELQFINKDVILIDIIAIYYFTEENMHGELNPMSYHTYMLMSARKLIKLGYMKMGRSIENVVLTEKGSDLKKQIDDRLTNHAKNLLFKGLMLKELSHILTVMSRFEVFWSFILSVKKDN